MNTGERIILSNGKRRAIYVTRNDGRIFYKEGTKQKYLNHRVQVKLASGDDWWEFRTKWAYDNRKKAVAKEPQQIIEHKGFSSVDLNCGYRMMKQKHKGNPIYSNADDTVQIVKEDEGWVIKFDGSIVARADAESDESVWQISTWEELDDISGEFEKKTIEVKNYKSLSSYRGSESKMYDYQLLNKNKKKKKLIYNFITGDMISFNPMEAFRKMDAERRERERKKQKAARIEKLKDECQKIKEFTLGEHVVLAKDVFLKGKDITYEVGLSVEIYKIKDGKHYVRKASNEKGIFFFTMEDIEVGRMIFTRKKKVEDKSPKAKLPSPKTTVSSPKAKPSKPRRSPRRRKRVESDQEEEKVEMTTSRRSGRKRVKRDYSKLAKTGF